MEKSCLLILLIFVFSCSIDQNDGFHQTLSQIEQIQKELNIDLKVDYSIRENEAIVFNSKEEFVTFLNSIKNRERVAELKESKLKTYLKTEPCDKLNGVFQGRALTSGFADLNITVSITSGSVEDVHTGFSGWTLGVGYEQSGYSSQPRTDSFSVITTGTINYSLFWNGVGTYYSENVRYQAIVPCDGGSVKVLELMR